MTVKQLEEHFASLKDCQTKSEDYQKKIDTKLDQIIAVFEPFTTKLDNLTQDFVQKCHHSEKDKFNHVHTVSQNNDQSTFSNVVMATISGPLHKGTSSTSHPIDDAYTDTYAATGHVSHLVNTVHKANSSLR